MFVVNNFIMAIVELLDFLLNLYMILVIGRAVITWVNADPNNPIVRFLYEITEPVLGRIRRFLPINIGGLDLSPLVLVLGIMFLQRFLIQVLKHYAMGMG